MTRFYCFIVVKSKRNLINLEIGINVAKTGNSKFSRTWLNSMTFQALKI